ncbi:MAG: hypothetical protein LBT19_00765 [Candidatus Nomurabacteria bacterium]|jgi:hypothetical protein|nr:hypothetical protein [Candidatus Nomurabacteria bacterium]
MKKSKNTKKRTNHIRIIIPVVLAGVAVWGIFALMGELSKTSNSANNTENTVTQPEEDPIKTNDPQNTDNVSDEKDITGGSDKTETPTTNPSTGLKNATVEITNASYENGQITASGQVNNVVETTGTCTYVFTNTSTGKTVTLTSDTLPSPSSTPCSSVSSNKSNFTTGKWSVILKYKSSYSEGESTSVTFTIN